MKLLGLCLLASLLSLAVAELVKSEFDARTGSIDAKSVTESLCTLPVESCQYKLKNIRTFVDQDTKPTGQFELTLQKEDFDGNLMIFECFKGRLSA